MQFRYRAGVTMTWSRDWTHPAARIPRRRPRLPWLRWILVLIVSAWCMWSLTRPGPLVEHSITKLERK